MGHLRQEVEPREAGLDPKALARLDQHFSHLVDDLRLPGYLVSVSGTAGSRTSPRTATATARPDSPSRPTPCGGSTR